MQSATEACTYSTETLFVRDLLISVVRFKSTYHNKLTTEKLTLLNEWIHTLQSLEFVPIYENHFVTCSHNERDAQQANPSSNCICDIPSCIQMKLLDMQLSLLTLNST